MLSYIARQARAFGQTRSRLLSPCPYSTSPSSLPQQPVTRHVTLPIRPSFYTGHPEYEELCYFLDDVNRAVSATQCPDPAPRTAPTAVTQWKSVEELKSVIGFQLSLAQHQRILEKLEALQAKNHHQHVYLEEFLSGFKASVRSNARTKASADQRSALSMSTATAGATPRPAIVGKRKTALAQVWLCPSPPPEPHSATEPRIVVNGKPLPDYFVRVKDVMMALQPLIRTARLPNYRVWCTVSGGGASGKAGAIAHGIAQSLSRVEPALHPVLLDAGILRRDTRVVERKKPGQKKARKKFTWVKR